MPNRLAQNMLDRLAGQPGEGTFEAHVTVTAEDLADQERFQTVCAELGVKSVLIELSRGQSRSQPMTATYHRGALPQVVEEVATLASTLQTRGFDIQRIKLEAVITNEGVPIEDDQARVFPPGNYFEFHVKVLLPPGAELESLRGLCGAYGGHLSSNARKREQDGRTERFVTQRVYGVGRNTAVASFDRLLTALEAAGYTLSNRLREYTIYDSNAALDAGWIDRQPGGSTPAGGSS